MLLHFVLIRFYLVFQKMIPLKYCILGQRNSLSENDIHFSESAVFWH